MHSSVVFSSSSMHSSVICSSSSTHSSVIYSWSSMHSSVICSLSLMHSSVICSSSSMHSSVICSSPSIYSSVITMFDLWHFNIGHGRKSTYGLRAIIHWFSYNVRRFVIKTGSANVNALKQGSDKNDRFNKNHQEREVSRDLCGRCGTKHAKKKCPALEQKCGRCGCMFMYVCGKEYCNRYFSANQSHERSSEPSIFAWSKLNIAFGGGHKKGGKWNIFYSLRIIRWRSETQK